MILWQVDYEQWFQNWRLISVYAAGKRSFFHCVWIFVEWRNIYTQTKDHELNIYKHKYFVRTGVRYGYVDIVLKTNLRVFQNQSAQSSVFWWCWWWWSDHFLPINCHHYQQHHRAVTHIKRNFNSIYLLNKKIIYFMFRWFASTVFIIVHHHTPTQFNHNWFINIEILIHYWIRVRHNLG